MFYFSNFVLKSSIGQKKKKKKKENRHAPQLKMVESQIIPGHPLKSLVVSE